MSQVTLKRYIAPVGMVLCLWCVSTSRADAQFLEKLEAAVRAQLEQQQNQAPSSAAQDGKSTKGGGESQVEELPPPSNDRPQAASPARSPLDGPRLVPSDNDQSRNDQSPNAQSPNAQSLPVPAPIGQAGTGDVNAEERRTYLGLDAEEPVGGGIGVRVVEVAQNSPAWKAGFKLGDRILAVNGFAIAGLDAMAEQLSPLAAGEAARFLVTRNNRNIELVAVLQDASLANKIATGAAVGPAWVGATVSDLTPAFRQQFGVSLFRAAAVTDVVPDSPAAQAGIRAGDAIAEVNGRRIEHARDFVEMLAAAQPGEVLELTVSKGITVQRVLVTLEEAPVGANARGGQPRRTLRSQNRVPLPSTVVPDLGGVPAVVPPRPAALPDRVPPPIVSPQSVAGIDDDEVLLPSPTPPPANATITSSREGELLEEVARLRSELDAANERLQATQRQLNAILRTLNGERQSDEP